MIPQKSAKPATAATVNGLQRDDRLGRQINFTANASSQLRQAFDHGLHDASQLLPATPISSPRANYEATPHSDIEFERLTVRPWRIEQSNLPTRPTKASDTRSKKFGDISVELDAIDPDRLRSLVTEAIEDHLPEQQLATLKAAEESEREALRALVGGTLNGGAQ